MSFKYVEKKCPSCGAKLTGDPLVLNSAGTQGLASCPNCGTGLELVDETAEPVPEPVVPPEPATEPATEPEVPPEPATEPATEPEDPGEPPVTTEPTG